MPSKKRKYNARFPAGRIKKIMQTDEEVGKVAQAVPIIIYHIVGTPRTLELFVESLLGKALQVTSARNAKTLSPSHVKQCILGEARFDFLRDLVKNIPDVSAAEEKELMSAETSPNSSRFTEAAAPPRRIAREDSTSSSSCEIIRVPQVPTNICSTTEQLKRALTAKSDITNSAIKTEPSTSVKIEPSTSVTPSNLPLTVRTPTEINKPILNTFEIEPGTSTDMAIDLSKKESRPVRTANFYQETLIDEVPHSSVIKVNPTYTIAQPSTSYTSLNPVEPIRKIEMPSPTFERHNSLPRTPLTPFAPMINIDFSKNIAKPEIKVLDVAVTPTSVAIHKPKHVSRQNSKSRMDIKKVEVKAVSHQIPVDIDKLNSGNPQIDEDYDT